MLYIRMALYALCAGAAGYGLATFDPQAGTVTFQIDELAKMLGGAAGFVATFIASRYAKHR